MHLQLSLIACYSTHSNRSFTMLELQRYTIIICCILVYSESILKYIDSELICLLSIHYHADALVELKSFKNLKVCAKENSAQIVQVTYPQVQYRPNVEATSSTLGQLWSDVDLLRRNIWEPIQNLFLHIKARISRTNEIMRDHTTYYSQTLNINRPG